MEYQVEDTTTPNDNSAKSAQPESKYYSEHGLTCQFEAPRLAVGGYSRRAIVYKIEGSTLVEVRSLSSIFGCS